MSITGIQYSRHVLKIVPIRARGALRPALAGRPHGAGGMVAARLSPSAESAQDRAVADSEWRAERRGCTELPSAQGRAAPIACLAFKLPTGDEAERAAILLSLSLRTR